MTKEHNNANLGIISSDSVSEYNAVDILDNFIKVKIYIKKEQIRYESLRKYW